ncbi:arginine repressor [Natranaerovirga pectinivora]|nr:arginine repressor [Natranaerovirga pectinivora]
MKIERQSKILQLINQYDIETQEDLAKKLTDAGFNVTQATISRDIRELRLTKAPASNGVHKYVVLENKEQQLSDKYIRILKDGFLSMERAQNIIVLKTVSGMAMAVAAALDAIQIYEVVGCIAGDDTIFCAVRTDDETIQVMEKIKRIVHSKGTI